MVRKPLIQAVAELYAARAVRAAQDPYEAWLADARAAVKRGAARHRRAATKPAKRGTGE